MLEEYFKLGIIDKNGNMASLEKIKEILSALSEEEKTRIVEKIKKNYTISDPRPFFDFVDIWKHNYQMLFGEPTEDLVNVVRCKNCTHSVEYEENLFCCFYPMTNFSVSPNGYCYNGERRSDE